MRNNKIPRMEGIIMFFYLSYTKITLSIQIIKLKIIQISGQGFGGSGRFLR